MKKWLRNIRLLVGFAALVAGLATAATTHGGLLWTGIDPIFVTSSGKVINVWVEWPSGRECSITGPIQTEVQTSAILVAESIESFMCDSGVLTVQTQTSVKDTGLPYHFNVKRVRVPATDSFPVQVKIYKNSVLAATCTGTSNSDISCPIISTH